MIDAKFIKENINIKDALEFYGLQFDRRGFAKCPFHNEKTASLSTKGDIYTCFGCNSSGDLINFVQNYFGLTFYEALKRISVDFNIDANVEIDNKEWEENKRLNDIILKAHIKWKEHLEYIYDFYYREYIKLDNITNKTEAEVDRLKDLELDIEDDSYLRVRIRFDREKGEQKWQKYINVK